MKVDTFVAWMLISIGGLIALLAGGCGLTLLSVAVWDIGFQQPFLDIIIMVGIFSGIPFLIGGVLLWGD